MLPRRSVALIVVANGEKTTLIFKLTLDKTRSDVPVGASLSALRVLLHLPASLFEFQTNATGRHPGIISVALYIDFTDINYKIRKETQVSSYRKKEKENWDHASHTSSNVHDGSNSAGDYQSVGLKSLNNK